jgi:hypothetical protein
MFSTSANGRRPNMTSAHSETMTVPSTVSVVLENEQRGIWIAREFRQALRQHVEGRIGDEHRIEPRNLRCVQIGRFSDDAGDG